MWKWWYKTFNLKEAITMVKVKVGICGLLCVMMLLVAASTFAADPIKISFWHAMSARRMKAVDKVIEGFHEAHPEIRIEPQFTGSYAETLSKAIAAVRSGEAPHIVQVYEVGTQTMLDSGAIVPLFELEKAGEVDYLNIVSRNDKYLAEKWGDDFWLKQVA